MKPELTIIIPTYSNAQGAIDLVNDFYRLHDPESFRIISIDQTEDGILFQNKVHLHIRSYRNLGFSKAINQGWKLSTTPYTLLANDDVRLLHPSWYEQAKACVSKDGVLAVNPFPATRTWDGGGNPVWYWDSEKNGEKFQFIKDKPFEEYTDEDYERLKGLLTSSDGPGTTMFFTLLKTEAREIVGLLDEAYWCGGEDYDWNRRCFLTCSNCNKRKDQHTEAHEKIFCRDKYGGSSVTFFEPYKINTCTHSLVHHQASVSKQNAVKAKEANGYDLVAKNKNIFNEKWGSEDCDNPDIYGKTGTPKPNKPWFSQVDL